jgi:hypothetical protein
VCAFYLLLAGIGKSMFRGYLLYCLCELHSKANTAFTVILQNSVDTPGHTTVGTCELLQFGYATQGAVATVHSERSPSSKLPAAWKTLLRDGLPNTSMYYITDGIIPDVLDLDPTKVRVLEVTSPQESRWKRFTNGIAAGAVVERLMPLVSLSEMLHMREHVGALDAAEVTARYRVLGGSVRGVLLRSNNTAEEIVVQALSHAATLDAVLSSNTMSGDLQGAGLAHIPSTLVHFRVSEEEEAARPLVNEAGDVASVAPSVAPPFSKYEPVFASNYVRREITTKFHLQFVTILSEMVNTANLPHTSVLQGNLFEEFAHQHMQAADSKPCPIRLLGAIAGAAAVAASVDLSGLPCVEFDDATELTALQLTDDHYYKPISKSFGAVDFVLGKDVVGNMTLNLRHGISLSALLRVVRAMGFQPAAQETEVPKLRFYWLLPTRALFQRMKPQPLSYRGRVVLPPANIANADAGQQRLQELQSCVELQQFAVLVAPSASGQSLKRRQLEEEEEESEEFGSAVSSTHALEQQADVMHDVVTPIGACANCRTVHAAAAGCPTSKSGRILVRASRR